MDLPKEIQEQVDEAIALDNQFFNTLKDKIGEKKAIVVTELANVFAIAGVMKPARYPVECLASALIDALELDPKETVAWITAAIARRTILAVKAPGATSAD